MSSFTNQQLDLFFSQKTTSLKICGVTQAEDAVRLAEIGVDSLGINFWLQSKRYCSPATARTFAPQLRHEIVRVGVFVNAGADEVEKAYQDDLIDVAQFHGDESEEFLSEFCEKKIPFIKAIGVSKKFSIHDYESFPTHRLLLDAHAPGVYGGTGETIDWNHAANVVKALPNHSIMLAGGITPENALQAVQTVRPSVIDIASGAEQSPGKKDFDKVRSILRAVRS